MTYLVKADDGSYLRDWVDDDRFTLCLDADRAMTFGKLEIADNFAAEAQAADPCGRKYSAEEA